MHMITQSSEESENEAVAGEPRGWEKRVMSLSRVQGSLGLSMVCKSNPMSPIALRNI